MRYRILGPLEVEGDDGRPVAVGGPQQRALLAALLLHANRVVSTDRLAAYLWGDQPPATVRGLLQGCVAQLRRALRTDGAGVPPLRTRSPGYVLDVRDGELDRQRFEALVASASASASTSASASAAGGLVDAAGRLAEALALWRGRPLDGVPLDGAEAELARLDERRLDAIELKIYVDLALGRRRGLIAELRAHVREHRLRERFWAQLMLALYDDERQAEALVAYHELRAVLDQELGVEPGPAMAQLHRAVLSGPEAVAAYRRRHGIAARPGDPVRPAGPAVPPGPGPASEPTASGPAEAAGPAGPGPAPADVPVPAQLPAAVSGFTGRTRHLAWLDERLPRPGAAGPGEVTIAAISGSAGVGKTALAVHWAHHVRDRFADGQLSVNLRGYGPGRPLRAVEALAGFLQALGVPAGQVPVDVEAAGALFRTLLAGRRMLVVLDNARDADHVRPLLPADPRCLVLVTSRDRLGGLVALDGAEQLALDVLTPDEAADLLRAGLGTARVAAEPAATAELARRCAYLPLALRICVANLSGRPGRRIADEAAALAAGDRLDVLEVGQDAAVRRSFDRSYGSLPPQARRLFRFIGLVPGPDVTGPAAAALLDAPPRTVQRALRPLVEANLLEPAGTDRYTCHDLLRHYAAERVAAEDAADRRTAAMHRLFAWYLAASDTAVRMLHPSALRLPDAWPAASPPAVATPFAGAAAALDWLDDERPNLMAAAAHASAYGPRPVAWYLTDRLRGYFWLRMDVIDWLALSAAGIAAAEADGDLKGEAAARLSIADAHRCQGRYEDAVEQYARAAALCERAGWIEGRMASVGNLGSAYLWMGRLSEAAEHYQTSLDLAGQAGHVAGQAVRLGNLGLVYWLMGRLTDAVAQHTRALAMHQHLGSRGHEAIDRANLAEAYHALGEYELAREHLDIALPLHREFGDRGAEAETLRVLAAVQSEDHGGAGARPVPGVGSGPVALATAAFHLAHETGDRPIEAGALNTLGVVHARLGEHRAAVDFHRRALQLARDTDTRPAELVALVGLSESYHRLGHLDDAVVCGQRALALARAGGFRMLEGNALTALAGVHVERGDLVQAREQAHRALAIHRATGHRSGAARSLAVLRTADRHESTH